MGKYNECCGTVLITWVHVVIVITTNFMNFDQILFTFAVSSLRSCLKQWMKGNLDIHENLDATDFVEILSN